MDQHASGGVPRAHGQALEGLKALLWGLTAGPRVPRGHRGVAPHPGTIFKKGSLLEPQSIGVASERIRDTTLVWEG